MTQQQKKVAATEPAEIAGRYQVVQRLGAGAFGTVYKAKDKLLGRMVAIKTIRLEGLAAQGTSLDELVKRFKQEAQVSAQLKHPNIVTIYDIGEAEGLSYLAMEFIDGVGLERVIASAGKVPVERAAAIAAQVADALDFAHRNSVVHRDIKPANIMIEAGDRVKVTDFGIAKVTSGGDHLTVTGSLLGTPSYMSPEQARGATLDGRSDLFAVGAVIYEMLTGRKAFRGDSITGLIFKIITEEPEPIREADPTIPEDMARIVSKAMAKNPDARYQNGKELAEDLLALTRPGSMPTLRQSELATAPALTPPPPPVPTLAVTPTVVAPTKVVPPPAPAPRPVPAAPVATTPRPAPQRSNVGLLIGLAAAFLVFVAMAAVAGWYFVLRRPAEPPAVASTATGVEPAAPRTLPPATAGATAEPEVPAGTQAETEQAMQTQQTGQAPASGAEARPQPQPAQRRAPTGAAPPPAAAGGPASGADESAGEPSFLDEEPAQPRVEGVEAGRKLAESFRGGRSPSYGAGARFQPRERSPRNLALVERPAVAAMRHVIDAQEAYQKKNGRYGSLSELAQSRSLFLDVSVQQLTFLRKGYRFELALERDGFRIVATPMTPGARPFVGDDTGIIRVGLE